jgi:hypothetical protein
MFIKFPSTTSILIAIVLALSGIGGWVACQQYFILQVQKREVLIRRTLDESSLTFMKAVGGESNPLVDKELAHRKTIIEGVDSNAAATIAQLEDRAIIDFIAWCVVFIITGWALFLNDRKQAEREKKGLG